MYLGQASLRSQANYAFATYFSILMSWTRLYNGCCFDASPGQGHLLFRSEFGANLLLKVLYHQADGIDVGLYSRLKRRHLRPFRCKRWVWRAHQVVWWWRRGRWRPLGWWWYCTVPWGGGDTAWSSPNLNSRIPNRVLLFIAHLRVLAGRRRRLGHQRGGAASRRHLPQRRQWWRRELAAIGRLRWCFNWWFFCLLSKCGLMNLICFRQPPCLCLMCPSEAFDEAVHRDSCLLFRQSVLKKLGQGVA